MGATPLEFYTRDANPPEVKDSKTFISTLKARKVITGIKV